MLGFDYPRTLGDFGLLVIWADSLANPDFSNTLHSTYPCIKYSF